MTRRPALTLDSSTITVAVWHNTTGMFAAWQPDDAMIKVFAFQIPAEAARTPDRVLAETWRIFNVGDDELARSYRARRLRSLSVGDVVAIGELAWAYNPIGYRQVAGRLTVTDVGVAGSTSLNGPQPT
ncbi:hypothetical protein GCM10009733_020950 [Nonomuraea maheshkhaliensis]|uniref:Uncharacterized protein n=2 Tax=Nonomuraea maheshkhaliensis TaxID=419590 RepID=A0ABN2EZX8_9ACTN